MIYKTVLRPLLFLLPPEKAHSFTLLLLRILFFIPGVKSSITRTNRATCKPVKVFGTSFPNKVGLAAGFDKNGKYFELMTTLGFGHIEVGTVTPKPQPGNSKPRVLRLKKEKALINRMGFNNVGTDALAATLQKLDKKDVVIGINIGKNKHTPNNNAVEDYVYCFNKLYRFADYFVVNVSSPNTPGLRDLQQINALEHILTELQNHNKAKAKSKPVLLKISPDLGDDAIEEIVTLCIKSRLAGIICSNTLKTNSKIGIGGKSGVPLKDRSTEMIKKVKKLAGERLSIIGVGGINSVEDAQEKLYAGANLVQLYTGLIYEGPKLIRDINKTLG